MKICLFAPPLPHVTGLPLTAEAVDATRPPMRSIFPGRWRASYQQRRQVPGSCLERPGGFDPTVSTLARSRAPIAPQPLIEKPIPFSSSHYGLLCARSQSRKRAMLVADDITCSLNIYPQSVIDRFWSKVDVRSDAECWPWTSPLKKSGYGQMSVDGAPVTTNRLAWEIGNGRLAKQGIIIPSCSNNWCCNPGHLIHIGISPIEFGRGNRNITSGPDLIWSYYNRVLVLRDGLCWPWLAGLVSGYGNFKVAGRYVGAHRFAWEIENAEELGDRWACHHCDNRWCCNPSHIYAGNAETNTRDAIDRGRFFLRIGEDSLNSKMTEDNVLAILRGDFQGMTTRELGAFFSVSKETIRRIQNRTSWVYLDSSEPSWLGAADGIRTRITRGENPAS